MSSSSNVPNVPSSQAVEVEDPEAQPFLSPRRSLSDQNVTQQLHQPLLSSGHLSSSSSLPDDQPTLMQLAISQTYQSSANLAKRLPTGTVLAFQLLSPIFTEVGRCTESDIYLTCCLLAICALSCFILSFTDSFMDESGKLRYGFATTSGLYVIDGLSPPPPEVVARYRVTILDFIHGFTSMMVFASVALSDKNVVMCFSPVPTRNIQEMFIVLPIGIGVLGSALFIVFPNNRHGIGFPIAAAG